MALQDIDVRATTSADPAAVHALLRDGATWPTWSGIGAFELVRPAPDGTEGVGAERLFTTGRVKSHERVVEVVPDRRFSYILLSGLPLRDYRADVDLEPLPDGGAAIRWHSTFRSKVPGTGWIYRRALGRFIRQTAEGLAAHAAKQPAPAPAAKLENSGA